MSGVLLKKPNNDSPTGCCRMIDHYLVAVVGQQPDSIAPIETADFMLSFDPMVIALKFCPFCGSALSDKTKRVGTKLDG
jgi:hypothetical protein